MAAVFRDAVAHQHQTLVSQQLTLLIPEFAAQLDSQSLGRLAHVVECLDGFHPSRQLQEQCQARARESLHILRWEVTWFDQIRDAEHRLFAVIAEHHTMENVVLTEFQLVVLERLEQGFAFELRSRLGHHRDHDQLLAEWCLGLRFGAWRHRRRRACFAVSP